MRLDARSGFERSVSAHVQRHGERFMVLERCRDRAADHALADGEVHVVLDHIAVVSACKGRVALKGGGKGDGKIVIVNCPVPLRRKQRQRQGLHVILLGDKAGDGIADGKGPASGKAAV